MRQLAQPQTLAQAAPAAILTALLCLPRFWLWDDRPTVTGSLALTVGFCAFVLWAFVFAWVPTPQRPLFHFPRDAGIWGLATLLGIAGGAALTLWVDPRLRLITPQDYPDSTLAWAAGLLFTLSLVQLFVCFAPFCFFFRLLNSSRAAALATVLFGVFLLGLKLQQTPVPDVALTLELLAVRLIAGGLGVYLFLRGGPWLVFWWAALLQARLLPPLL